jgi:hypothetical protein
LNTTGSLRDIEAWEQELRPGMEVLLYDGELEYEAVLSYDETLKIWKGRVVKVRYPQ